MSGSDKPLPILDIKVRFSTDSPQHPYDVVITSKGFSFSFTFKSGQHALAVKFSRLCRSILLRLRCFFFWNLEKPHLSHLHLILPLIRIIDEIITDYSAWFLNLLPEPQISNTLCYSVGLFTDFPAQTTSFPNFLFKLKSNLIQLTNSQNLPLYDHIHEIFHMLDIASSMVEFQTHYIYRLHHPHDYYDDELISNESNLRRQIFIEYLDILKNRIDFDLS